MNKKLWSLIPVLLWCELAGAYGISDSFIPSSKHVTLLENRGKCSVYSAVQKRLKQRYQDFLVAYSGQKKVAKQRREALVLCGAPSEDSRRALQEEDLADKCPQEYSAWLHAGELYIYVETELKEAQRSLQKLSQFIVYQCGKLPEFPASLPPEPEKEPSQPPAPPELHSEEVPAENPN